MRRQRFSPDLAEQAVQGQEYGQIPATYKPQQPGLSPQGQPFPERPPDPESTFTGKLLRNLTGAGQAMRQGFGTAGTPGTSLTETGLGTLQGLLGVLGGAFALPGAAAEHYIGEPISNAIGGKTGAFAGGVAEQLPFLGLGALKGAAKAPRVTGAVPPNWRAAGAKILRARPGIYSGSEFDPQTGKGSFYEGLRERRGPGRATQAEWEQAARERAAAELPNPQGEATTPPDLPRFRDPISHRQTEMDPGFFGPLIEDYYKSLTREGIGPSISGGAPRPRGPFSPTGWNRTTYNPFQGEDLESIRHRILMGRDLTDNPTISTTEIPTPEPELNALRSHMHPDIKQGYLQAGGALPNEARPMSRENPVTRRPFDVTHVQPSSNLARIPGEAAGHTIDYAVPGNPYVHGNVDLDPSGRAYVNYIRSIPEKDANDPTKFFGAGWQGSNAAGGNPQGTKEAIFSLLDELQKTGAWKVAADPLSQSRSKLFQRMIDEWKRETGHNMVYEDRSSSDLMRPKRRQKGGHAP